MQKNAQITIQLYSFHMPASYAQNFQLGFSNTWTQNKLDLEKAEEIANIHWIIEKLRECRKKNLLHWLC